jgi:hypothetical protein
MGFDISDDSCPSSGIVLSLVGLIILAISRKREKTHQCVSKSVGPLSKSTVGM